MNDQAIFTRAEYLATAHDRELSAAAHRRYYAQFVNAHTIAHVARAIGAAALRHSTDPHLNDIPLRCWDGLARHLPLAMRFEAAGDYATLGNLVCIAKEAARQWIEANKESTP